MPITCSTYEDACDALKNGDLEQALYDAGAKVMADALITLHGEEHRRRRIVEYGVFSKKFFRLYETDIFPRTLKPLLAHHGQQDYCDLVELGYQLTMNLTADFAGIDRLEKSIEETQTLLHLVKTFSAGATMVHSTLVAEQINEQVDEALVLFDTQFLKPSVTRRQALIRDGQELPNDVLSKILSSDVSLTPDVLRREMAFYLQAGAHSTANSIVHAFHEIDRWQNAEGNRTELLADDLFLQRCVHESLRLHPASPVAWRRALENTEVAGHKLQKGEKVIIDLAAANQDVNVFGSDAQNFNPIRALPNGVWPFGLTFGLGVHACMGRALDGGVLPASNAPHQLGIVTLVVKTLLSLGASVSKDNLPQKDESTSRNNWGYYPVKLGTVT